MRLPGHLWTYPVYSGEMGRSMGAPVQPMSENRLATSVLTALVEIERFSDSLESISAKSDRSVLTQATTRRLYMMLHTVSTNLRIASEYIDLELERNVNY